jgi:hypothetical protein
VLVAGFASSAASFELGSPVGTESLLQPMQPMQPMQLMQVKSEHVMTSHDEHFTTRLIERCMSSAYPSSVPV